MIIRDCGTFSRKIFRVFSFEGSESSEEERPYCAKVTKIKEILQNPSPPDVNAIAHDLGWFKVSIK